MYNEKTYQKQLAEKTAQLNTLLKPFLAPAVEVFESPRAHYRMRAEFRIWHEGDDFFYAMFEPGDKTQPIRIEQAPMVAKPIYDLMAPLLVKLKQSQALSRKLFQVDFLSTLSGEVLVSLLYHKPIAEEWTSAAQELAEELDIGLIGRSRKTKIVLNRDFVEEVLPLSDQKYTYQQVENSFTQPNAEVAIKMIEWARSSVGENDDDLLELYCGNGNFSIALAKQFRKVLATEVAKSSVNSAQYNINKNQIDNLKIVRLSSEEFTQAMANVREFRRLKEREVDLADYNFSTVLVDPPRAGLDEDTVAMVSKFNKILYISCNPLTLINNLKQLTKTHNVIKAALFDQFPYTEHIEAGVFLQKK